MNTPEVNEVLKDISSAPIHERKYMMPRLREAINGQPDKPREGYLFEM